MKLRKLKDYSEIALKSEDLTGYINFRDIFGRSRAVHIEVGTGKGTFLLNQAKANPNLNFLGIEWANRYYRYAVDRMGRWGITNVRIIRTDAAEFIANHLGAACIDCFHLYFPDPWPKKRHHKRRFFNQTNLDQMLRILVPSGNICIATDHLGYFQAITELIDSNSDSLEHVDFFAAAGAGKGEWVGSNFERKYIKKGKKIYPIAVRKTARRI